MVAHTQYASYYSSSLGPVSVGRVLICKQCRKYIACMDDLLSKVSTIYFVELTRAMPNFGFASIRRTAAPKVLKPASLTMCEFILLYISSVCDLIVVIIISCNVALGERQVWLMRTGAHTVRELHCIGCEAYVGFRIVHAHEPSERWKDGAYILEREFLFLHSVYEGDETVDMQRQWLSPPLRLKVIDDLRRNHKQKKHVRISSDKHFNAPIRPLPKVPLPVEAC